MNSSGAIDIGEPGDPKTARFPGTVASFTFPGPFVPAQRGCPEVRHAVMATTTVESLNDSSNQNLKIAGILSHHGRAPEEEEEEQGEEHQSARTLMYIVYSHKANSGLCWRSTCVGSAVQRLCDMSIPNNVRELCDRCFEECKSLRRVTFGSSSSLERIGVSCFARSGVEEASIPDSVCELCDHCFEQCKSLRRVTFGSSSSVERIGASCFAQSGVKEVRIPDSVRELCDHCFKYCRELCRVTFGSSLERIGVYCFAESSVGDVSFPDSVRELGDRCFEECMHISSVTFGASSSLQCIGDLCFGRNGVEELIIPASLCDLCFPWLEEWEDLCNVRFLH